MADPRLGQLPTIYDAIRLGVVDFEIAPLGTAYDADASFERLGRIVPGSFSLEAERELYNVEAGVPKSIIKSFVIGQSGTVGVELMELTPRAIDVANGGQKAVYTTTDATTVSAAPVPTTSVFTVAAIGTIKAGSWITVVVGSEALVRKVKAINGSAITVDALPAAPESGAAIAKITSAQVPGGGTQIQERTARAVFTDVYDDRFIYYFPKVVSTGGMAPDFKDGASEAVLPLEFNLHGVQATVDGNTDTFLYHSHFVPKA